MAIEFNCPYCTSPIRVGDDAAGKRGRCPRCKEQLVVPAVERPEEPPAPAEQSPASAPPAGVSPQPVVPVMPRPQAMPPAMPQPVASPQAEGQPAPVPNYSVAAPLVVPTAPVSVGTRTRRRRRGSNRLAIGILGFCFLVIVGLLIGQHFANRKVPLEGTLVGEFVQPTVLQPVKVPAGDSGLSEAQLEPIVTALQQSPVRAGSQLVHTELHGTDGGLEVKMIPTPSARVVRVNPADSKVLASWLAENSKRLLAKRSSDLAAASSRFFNDYKNSIAGGPKVTLDTYYRNELGLAAMCSGFGYSVEAVAGRQQCPCIAEDFAGNLYFAVPSATEQLTLRGRTMNDGRKLFDGTFTVDCDISPEQIETVEPSTPPAEKSDESQSSADKEPGGAETSNDGTGEKNPSNINSPGMMGDESKSGMMMNDQ